jgi:branched-chain amino acid transport system substrate-binding protein
MRSAAFLMLGACLWAATPLAHADEPGVSEHELVIGALGVLTGPLYNNGKTIYDGVQTVYNEVNAAGGIYGRKLTYVREDDACRPDQAVPAAKKLIFDDKVFMIHGAGCSNASLAAMPEIAAAKIPWVITASTAPELTTPTNPFIFTTMLTGAMESQGELQRILDLGGKKIAIVRQRDAWAQSRYQPLLDAFAAHGIKPVGNEEMSPDATDATAVALKLQASGADSVVALLFPQAATMLMRDSYKVGFRPTVVGGSAIGDLKGMDKAIGIKGALDKFSALFPTVSPDDPGVATWKAAFQKYYPHDEFNVWNLFGIASGQFVVQALKDAGPNPTRASVIAAMDKLSVTSPAYAGPITCKPDDHRCYRSMEWYAVSDGAVKQVGSTTLPQ